MLVLIFMLFLAIKKALMLFDKNEIYKKLYLCEILFANKNYKDIHFWMN